MEAVKALETSNFTQPRNCCASITLKDFREHKEDDYKMSNTTRARSTILKMRIQNNRSHTKY